MKKAAVIEVFGRVQGVGFRYYAVQTAKNLGLTGFVRNKSDGSVYIEAEGEESSLLQLIEWCQNGPQWARVREVNHFEIPTINHQEFIIK